MRNSGLCCHSEVDPLKKDQPGVVRNVATSLRVITTCCSILDIVYTTLTMRKFLHNTLYSSSMGRRWSCTWNKPRSASNSAGVADCGCEAKHQRSTRITWGRYSTRSQWLNHSPGLGSRLISGTNCTIGAGARIWSGRGSQRCLVS